MTSKPPMQLLEFEYLQACLGIGSPPPSGWRPIASLPMVVMVGVTGTGKTTTVQALFDLGCEFHMLPDRRLLTDRLIIAPLQREDIQPVKTLPRMQRVPYIRRYKRRHPAGLAYALSQLHVDPEQCKYPLLFDGLRGDEEVSYAAKALPNTKFVVLDALDIVRTKRLLDRRDPYDRMTDFQQHYRDKSSTNEISDFKQLDVPEAEAIFTPEEEQELLGWLHNGDISLADLRNILKLVSVERSLYQKEDTISALLALAPERTLVIDTTSNTVGEVAQEIVSEFGELCRT
jgi:hypothetical protein